MKTVTSKDGTTIAYDQAGQGPTLILVGGLFEQRAMESETAQLAASPLLAQHFTVVHYDRRGRGDSTDTLPYAVEREIEDIEALIDAVGRPAFLSGLSSGGALVLEAALALGSTGKVRKIAIYEAPYNDDENARHAWRELRKNLKQAHSAGRYEDMVGHMMMTMGVQPDQLDEMKQYPMWPMWQAIAPTIDYETTVLGEEAAVPTERAARLTVPALIMDGSESYPFMHTTALALAKAIPNAQHRTLQGQTHEVSAEVLAPLLVEFFTS